MFNILSSIWTKPNLSNNQYFNYDFIKHKTYNSRKESSSTSLLKYYSLKNHNTSKCKKLNQTHHENYKKEDQTTNYLPVIIKNESKGNEVNPSKKKKLLLNHLQKLNTVNINKKRNFTNLIDSFHFKNNHQKNLIKIRKNIMTEWSNEKFYK